MKSKAQTALIVILALSTAIATGFAIQRGRVLAALQAAADDSLDRASLERRLADAEARTRALADELAALKGRDRTAAQGDDEPPPPPGEEGAGGRPEGFRRRGRDGAMAALMENPEFAKVMHARQLSQLDSRYASLFKKLMAGGKLSQSQLDSLKGLLAEQQNTMRDVMMTARQQGVTDRRQIDALIKTAQTEIDAQIQSTLGADAYAEYQQYTQTAAQRQLVSQIETSLSYSSAPLTADQSEKLIQALYAASAASGETDPGAMAGAGGPGGGGPGGPGGPGVRITDTMITAAQSVLSTTQLQALTNLQQQQQAERAMMQTMRANRQNASSSSKSK